ncbi:MAG: glycerophosphodiester phosphodiesterase [Minisyncoccota bacterium]
MRKTHIITHRGLDPDRTPYFTESSQEAFIDQLTRGYGIEFDIQFTQDEKIVVIHDTDLKRLTKGVDKRNVADIQSNELLTMDFDGNHLTTLSDLLSIIQKKANLESYSALHIKHMHQTPSRLITLLETLQKTNLDKLILFDLTPQAARYISQHSEHNFNLAASVSHPYDIERYNTSVGGTLVSIETLLKESAFTWAWLDEWDLRDKDGGTKSLYNTKVFDILRKNNIHIALVTPELHATSPGLLGGESHQDAINRDTFEKRVEQILGLKPDAVCTDYPDYIKSLL